MSFGHDRPWLSAIELGDSRAVTLPRIGAAEVVDRIDRDLCPLLIVGHHGVGKTSLLHAVSAALTEREGGFCVHVDLLKLSPLRADRVLFDLAVETVQAWVQGGPEQQPSPFLVQDLRASDPSFPQGQGRTLSPAEIARATWDELTGAAGMVERLPLLIDGLDRVQPELARTIARSLLDLTSRADLVVVASPQLGYGPDNADLLDAWRTVAVGPLDPSEPSHHDSLVQVVLAHGGPDLEPVAPQIAELSGGVLRDLVGLVHDVRAYADDAIDAGAVARAAADRCERLRRLLVAGDLAALRAADGSSGAEVPADRKVRLLESGLLLEYGLGPGAIVRPHPLLRPLFAPLESP